MSEPRWEYLKDPLFQSRQALVRHWLSDSPFLLEIGGWLTPVGGVPMWLNVDPLAEPGPRQYPGTVHQLCRNFNLPLLYDLVMLGIDHYEGHELEAVEGLLKGARKVVLETSVNHIPGILALQHMAAHLDVLAHLDMQLQPPNAPTIGHPLHGERRMIYGVPRKR